MPGEPSAKPSIPGGPMRNPSANAGHSLPILILGAMGVVYGDIGTSPLYAFREALGQAADDGISRGDIIGILSLALWTLILVVTLKYVLLLSRMDNDGEGGVLSMMALASRATSGRWLIVMLLGAAGATLFYGDAIITPALSVLSAVEGLKTIPGLDHVTEPVILTVATGILVALFAIQSRGTALVSALFGPVCALWFLVLAGLGLWHIADAPGILAAFNPVHAVRFLASEGTTGLFVLGAVFLTVTGAEALIADMGHFGRRPIQIGWLGFVWPALTLNYLGQGALALNALAAAEANGTALANADWFFLLAPDALRAPLVILATLATIIASQAVITGAYSLTRQAVALGMLPRLKVRQTSERQIGQIYMPAVNWLLLAGVLILVLGFRSSSSMAAAYGIAVTGTMLMTTCLAFIIAWKHWGWSLPAAAALAAPFLALDLFFFGANMLRVAEGGWAPLLVSGILGLVMLTWVQGRRAAARRVGEPAVGLQDVARALSAHPPAMAEGTAVFLTEDTSEAPSALLHNIKHNKVLHRFNLVLKIETRPTPHVAPEDRLTTERVDDRFATATLRYGYMDRIDVPSDLARQDGLMLAAGGTSFFVGRKLIRQAARPVLPRAVSGLYRILHRNAADPIEYFSIPPNRVIELGSQIEL